MVEYAHLLDPDLTAILFTNNQGFNPYRMTIEVMRFFAPLGLVECDAVLLTPLDGHLPKLDLFEPIPSVPQVVFGE